MSRWRGAASCWNGRPKRSSTSGSASPPPPALGPVPKALNDPAVKMLWGVTSETIEAWSRDAGGTTEAQVRGYAASPGVVEGTARVLLSVNEIGQVRDGEILVCPVT